MEGARLIPSFLSTTEEEYTPDSEQLDEARRLGEETWVRESELNLSNNFTRNFRKGGGHFNPTHFVDEKILEGLYRACDFGMLSERHKAKKKAEKLKQQEQP